jgi:hypothetical protein
MNFLKDHYLAPGLEHSDGDMRFVVFVSGKVAGGFIYRKDARRDDEIYLICDFSVSRDRRLSKLVAMLATGEEPVNAWQRQKLVRIRGFSTTAFTDKPVSMKYRGIYELAGRKPGFLNYRSEVRRVSSQAIYTDWWRRFGGSARSQ